MNRTNIIIIWILQSNINISAVASESQYDKFEIRENFLEHRYTFHTIIKGIEMLSKMYDITLHFDSITKYNSDEIVKHSTQISLAGMMVVNYDQFSPDNPIRIPQSTKNVAHLIILQDPRNFVRYMQMNKRATDIAIFLCIRQKREDGSCQEDESFKPTTFLNKSYASTIYRVFILDFLETEGRLFSICYYCGENSFKLLRRFREDIKSDAPSKMLEVLFWRITHTFVDLELHSFKLGFVVDDAFFICVNKRDIRLEEYTLTLCDRIEGIQGAMLYELSRIMNFTYELITPHRSKGGLFQNAVLSANETKVEWSVGSITVTDNRIKMVTFSIIFGSDPLRYLYADFNKGFLQSMGAISALDLFAWMSLVASIIIIAFILSLYTKIRGKLLEIKMKDKAFSKNIEVVGTLLIEQSLNGIHTIDGRGLIAVWLICALIISSAYKGKLSSDIMNPRQLGILTLEQLTKQGYVLYLNRDDASFTTEVFLTSNDTTYKTLASRIRTDLSICEAAAESKVSKVLIVEEESVMLRKMNKICAKSMSFDDLSKFRISPQPFHPSDHAWAFRNRSPFLKTVNKHLMRMVHSGLYKKWAEIYHKRYITDPIQLDGSLYKNEIKVNNLKAFFAIFLLWMVGIGLSIVFFVFELVFSRLQRESSRFNKRFGIFK